MVVIIFMIFLNYVSCDSVWLEWLNSSINVVLKKVSIEFSCVFNEKVLCLYNIVRIFVKIGDIEISKEVFVVVVYLIDIINSVW